MLSHIPVTRIVIPIPFPRENPLLHSRKIHGRIHSRSQVDPRLYLLSSCRFSCLTCFSELIHHMCRKAIWLTNKSTYPWRTSQSIIHWRNSLSSWPSTTGTVSPNSATNMNNWEGLDQYVTWNILSPKRLITRSNVKFIAHCFHRLHFENYDCISYIAWLETLQVRPYMCMWSAHTPCKREWSLRQSWE
jgi:hypothetical protein